jgi:hypothetical protein
MDYYKLQKAGIDKLNLTFPIIRNSYKLFIDEACTLLEGVERCHFQKVDNTVRGQRGVPKINWYQESYYLKSSEGATVLAVHTKPISYLGGRNLIQFNGLAFSQSALNPLRPLNLEKLVTGTVNLHGRVSALDVYLDDHTGLVPFDEIQRQALPANFKRYIRSPFVKAVRGRQAVPRIFENGAYFGGKSGCQLLSYNKRLYSGQRVAEGDNLLKHPWYRLELRLRHAVAKKAGGCLL